MNWGTFSFIEQMLAVLKAFLISVEIFAINAI